MRANSQIAGDISCKFKVPNRELQFDGNQRRVYIWVYARRYEKRVNIAARKVSFSSDSLRSVSLVRILLGIRSRKVSVVSREETALSLIGERERERKDERVFIRDARDFFLIAR